MATTSLDTMRDQEVDRFGEDVQLQCECGEAWSVTVYGGEDLTLGQLECPASDCDGEGTER
jgi:hypothetical protein